MGWIFFFLIVIQHLDFEYAEKYPSRAADLDLVLNPEFSISKANSHHWENDGAIPCVFCKTTAQHFRNLREGRGPQGDEAGLGLGTRTRAEGRTTPLPATQPEARGEAEASEATGNSEHQEAGG